MIRSIALLAVFAMSLMAVAPKTVNIIPMPACDPNCPFIQ